MQLQLIFDMLVVGDLKVSIPVCTVRRAFLAKLNSCNLSVVEFDKILVSDY